jgi:S1-C subfamily serine protease
MLNWRVPWWMYLAAGVYVLTFLFNARQEASGPANAGWVPVWPAVAVASVASGRAMEKAGLRAGDVLEAVNGQPITRMPDWFVARAHFERKQPIKLQIQRGWRRHEIKHRMATVYLAAYWSIWWGTIWWGTLLVKAFQYILPVRLEERTR